jgi:hypothetical protein
MNQWAPDRFYATQGPCGGLPGPAWLHPILARGVGQAPMHEDEPARVPLNLTEGVPWTCRDLSGCVIPLPMRSGAPGPDGRPWQVPDRFYATRPGRKCGVPTRPAPLLAGFMPLPPGFVPPCLPTKAPQPPTGEARGRPKGHWTSARPFPFPPPIPQVDGAARACVCFVAGLGRGSPGIEPGH